MVISNRNISNCLCGTNNCLSKRCWINSSLDSEFGATGLAQQKHSRNVFVIACKKRGWWKKRSRPASAFGGQNTILTIRDIPPRFFFSSVPHCLMRFLHFQLVFLVHFIYCCDSFCRVHSCADQIPHLPTSVVLHSDRQSNCGCFGSRTEFMCQKNTLW